MKLHFNLILFIVFLLPSKMLLGQQLYHLQGDQAEDTWPVLTGNFFTATISFPSPPIGCNKIRIEYTFPSDKVSIRSVDKIEFERISGNIVVSKPGYSLDQISDLTIELQLSDDGIICENEPIPISAVIHYLNDSDNSLCSASSINSNILNIIPKYDDNVHIPSITVMNNHDACIGGFVRYKIRLNYIDPSGGFNLSQLLIRTALTGEVISLFDNQGNAIDDWTEVASNECQKTIEWNAGNINVYWIKEFYLVIKPSCTCFDQNQTGQNLTLDVQISGLNPCGANITYQAINNTSFSFCCGSGNTNSPYNAGKWTSGNLCPGSCEINHYKLVYKNDINPYNVQNLTFYDELPEGVIVDNIKLDFDNLNNVSSNPIELCYKYSSNTNWICEIIEENSPNQVISFVDNISSSNPNSLYVPVGERVTHLKWTHLGVVLAWEPQEIRNFIYFFVDSEVENLEPNIAQITRQVDLISSTIDDEGFIQSGGTPNCETRYHASPQVKRVEDPDADYQFAFAKGEPLETLRFRYYFSNNGSVSEPTTFQVTFPEEIEFLGLNTIYYFFGQNLTNDNDYIPLPTNQDISYDPATRKLTWSNFELEPSCLNYNRTAIYFDVKIKAGTLVGDYYTTLFFDGSNETNNVIQVLKSRKAFASIQPLCDDVPLELNSLNIESGKELAFLLKVENVGNIPIRDIVMNHPRTQIGDVRLSKNENQVITTPRGSEFDIAFLEPLSSLTGSISNQNFTNSVNDLCDLSTSSVFSNSDYLQVKFPGTINAGESFQLKLNGEISANSSLGQAAYSDFFFCGIDASIVNEDIYVSGSSNTLQINISDEEFCPEPIGCSPDEEFTNLVDDAFSFSIDGNEITANCSSLSQNFRWIPMWGDGTVGGAGFQWGTGTYGITHQYSETGTYTVCVKVENFQDANDPNSENCNCDIICKEVTI